jgi:hypothetical protein
MRYGFAQKIVLLYRCHLRVRRTSTEKRRLTRASKSLARTAPKIRPISGRRLVHFKIRSIKPLMSSPGTSNRRACH